MKRLLGWLVACLVLVFVFSYAWTHRHRAALAVATGAPLAESRSYDEEQQAQKMVTVAGPLANYVQRQAAAEGVETLEPTAPSVHGARKPQPSDHVLGDSPVGTSTPLLHKTFNVKKAVDLPFEIAAHAATPQLRGTYRSFAQGGMQDGDSAADVEFMLMTEKQFADFLDGRPSDAIFSADDAHEGEVNVDIPPTFDRSAKYYLLFRNPGGKAKKVVQADFQIDY